MRHLEGRAQKRCYFAVTREGKPYRAQRKPFTECFFAMALWGMYEITGEEALKVRAEHFVLLPCCIMLLLRGTQHLHGKTVQISDMYNQISSLLLLRVSCENTPQTAVVF